MLNASTKELKNIPISLSLLHEQEYQNLCTRYNIKICRTEYRRTRSERLKRDDANKIIDSINMIVYTPRITCRRISSENL